MPDPTNAARQRAWYARQKAGTPWQPLICKACGGNSSGTHDPFCSRCWERLTPEGRAAKAKRVRLSRARQRVDRQT
jgi:predicted amidophosphoribosyltransferase